MERKAARIDVIIPIYLREIPENEIKTKVCRIAGEVPGPAVIESEGPIDEALHSWFTIINNKLDYIINLLVKEKEGFQNLPEKLVNFSEYGLRVCWEKPIPPGHFVEIKTILEIYQPISFYLYGKVLRCEKKENCYDIAVEFVNLPSDIRDKLSVFVLNKEREKIREKINW